MAETVENERMTGYVIFARTIKIAVSASVWSHGGHWGGTVTFAEPLAIETGDMARLMVATGREYPIVSAAVTHHEGGETTLTFDGFGKPPRFSQREVAASEGALSSAR